MQVWDRYDAVLLIVLQKKNTCIFNSLPNLMADLAQNRKKIIEYLKSVLMEESIYLVNVFLDYCGALWEIECL